MRAEGQQRDRELAAGGSSIKEIFFFQDRKIIALYAGANDPVKREKLIQKREGGTASVVAWCKHRKVQRPKILPETRTWTVHLPHGRESKPRGDRRWPWGDAVMVSSVTSIFSRK